MDTAQDTYNGLIIDISEINKYVSQAPLILFLIVQSIFQLVAGNVALFA